VFAWLLPYRAAPDTALATRFAGLGALPATSFGHAFLDHFAMSGYDLPGSPDALNAAFSVPHDSAHVLAGYDTSPGGEILVSTFTAAMHPRNAMAAHVLPVILSWHLGIKFNDVAKSATGTLDPAGFFDAWRRGHAVNTDLFGRDWDF
jgi:ubiquinone biosynthesis protein Coq4